MGVHLILCPYFVLWYPEGDTDGTNDGPEGSGDQLREHFWLGPVISLGGAIGSAPARRSGHPGSTLVQARFSFS